MTKIGDKIEACMIICAFLGLITISLYVFVLSVMENSTKLMRMMESKKDIIPDARDMLKQNHVPFKPNACMCPFQPVTTQKFISSITADTIVIGKMIGKEPEPDYSKCSIYDHMSLYGLIFCKGENCCKDCIDKFYPTEETKNKARDRMSIFAGYCLNLELLEYVPEIIEFFESERKCRAKLKEFTKLLSRPWPMDPFYEPPPKVDDSLDVGGSATPIHIPR